MRRTLPLLVYLAGCSPAGQSLDPDATAGTDPDATEVDAPAAPAEDLAALLEPIRAGHDTPALAAAVFRGPTLIAEGAVGVRKLGDLTKVTTSDRWHIGSNTKAMTATLLALNADLGGPTLDTTLGSVFAADGVSAGYTPVTMRSLLEHRGGAPGNVPALTWYRMQQSSDSRASRRAAVLEMLDAAPAQSPGTFTYANAGYMMVGAAIEQQRNVAWEDAMRDQIFTPLGMTDCGFGAPATPPDQVDQPWGHRDTFGLAPVAPGPGGDNPVGLGPAGTVNCSLASYGKFAALHLAAARNEPTALLTPARLQELQTPNESYACGWGVHTFAWSGGPALNHAGSNTMFFFVAVIAPAKNLTIVLATNAATQGAQMALTDALDALATKYAN